MPNADPSSVPESSFAKPFLAILGAMAVVAAVVLAVPLCVGVWLPDVLSPSTHVLAEARTRTGHRLQIVQFWNRIDFYTTEARITGPDGQTETRVLDPDDRKRWRATLTIDEERRSAAIDFGRGQDSSLHW